VPDGTNPFLLPLLDTLRTEYFSEIMAFEPLIPAIQRLLHPIAA